MSVRSLRSRWAFGKDVFLDEGKRARLEKFLSRVGEYTVGTWLVASNILSTREGEHYEKSHSINDGNT
jgi:hypothetical protein